MLGGKDQDD